MKAPGPALSAALLLVLAGPATAQTPPEGFSWYVLNRLNGFYLDVEDPTNRSPLLREVPEGVLTPVEINGDGRTDWLIAWPEEAQFCGTGGCQRSLYVSGEHGFVRAFDRQALELTITPVDGEMRVEAWVHHLECADDRRDCRYAWVWDARIERLVERPASDGRTILNGGPEPLVDLGEETDGQPRMSGDWPPQLAQAWRTGRSTCPSPYTDSGLSTTWPLIREIPDLNGDGLRDWLFTPSPPCGEAEPGFQVWVTSGRGAGPHGEGGQVDMVWEAGPDEGVAFDISRTPVQLQVTSGCDYGLACPGRPLRLDPRTGRFTPAS